MPIAVDLVTLLNELVTILLTYRRKAETVKHCGLRILLAAYVISGVHRIKKFHSACVKYFCRFLYFIALKNFVSMKMYYK